MRWTRILAAVLALVVLGAGTASAQTVLRIGLNDDPDALDPTISRAYVDLRDRPGLNVLGDGLRDVLDPKHRSRMR